MARRVLSGADRGQTTQDFAIGIGLFLLAVVFVVAFIPSILAPADDPGMADRSAQAERLAAELVAASAVDGERVILDEASLTAEMMDVEDLAAAMLGEDRSVNVTLEMLDGTVVHGAGADDAGETTGRWVRLVATDEACDPACRLIIRVW